MALGPRLDLRQSQSLVMTPQLQQAIKLLALSNLELETFIGEALEANPLLEMGEVSARASAPPRSRAEPPAADRPADRRGRRPTTAARHRRHARSTATAIPATGDWSAAAASVRPARTARASTSAAATSPRWPSISRAGRRGRRRRPATAFVARAADRPARRGGLPAPRRCARSPATLGVPLAEVERGAGGGPVARSDRRRRAHAWPNASRCRPRRPTATIRAWRG